MSTTAQETTDLGRKVLLAKQAAPTRPHPSAPDTPPANLILDTGAGMIDKLRDACPDVTSDQPGTRSQDGGR